MRIACRVTTGRGGAGGLALDELNVQDPAAAPEVWERAIVKLRTRTMPPVGRPRPDDAAYETAVNWLEGEIDRAWDAATEPPAGWVQSTA